MLVSHFWNTSAVNSGPLSERIYCGVPCLISSGYSASRISAVLTDAPFASTPKREFGIDKFCSNCRICEDAYPPIAIDPDKTMIRGVERWYVDFDKCIPYLPKTQVVQFASRNALGRGRKSE